MSRYKTLIIQGWNVGFQKVEFTNMVRRELGLSLTEGKGITDRILRNERVELQIASANSESVAKLALELGAIVVTSEMEGVCR